MSTHGLIVEFGKHKGELYTRIPVSYLRWMVQCGHQESEIARAELERRGTTLPTVEISGHAIDTASLRVRKIWHETRAENEGLNSWLIRMCNEALEESEPDADNRVHYNGMRLVFESGEWPVLKTVMRKDKK